MKRIALIAILLTSCLCAQAENLQLADGTTLENIGAVKFAGDKFKVEHDGGIASVAWENMRADYRAKFPKSIAVAQAEKESQEARRVALLAKLAEEERMELERRRVESLPKVYIRGNVRQETEDGFLVTCEKAPTRRVYAAPYGNLFWIDNTVRVLEDDNIFVKREDLNAKWKDDSTVDLLARIDGTFSYTGLTGKKFTVPKIEHSMPFRPTYCLMDAAQVESRLAR